MGGAKRALAKTFLGWRPFCSSRRLPGHPWLALPKHRVISSGEAVQAAVAEGVSWGPLPGLSPGAVPGAGAQTEIHATRRGRC